MGSARFIYFLVTLAWAQRPKRSPIRPAVVKAPKGYCYPNLKNPEKSRIVPEVKKTLNPTTWFAQTFDALDGADDTFGTFTPDGQGPPSFPAEGCPCKKKKGKK